MRTAAFSIISPNYRHFVRVLMASLEKQHPEWDRFVLLVGEGPSEGGADAPPGPEAFTTVPLDALPLPDRRKFCFRYTILELNTAVKPWMFEHLFARGYDRVIYFDPDVVLYSPLIELDENAFLTLTPHLTGSIAGDDHPSERSILQAGTYNLGFLAVTRQAQLASFLGWWKEKLEFQCVVDTAHGLFVDQKWIDLAPGLFDGVAILRHDGYNVAYWNLGQRTLAGQPLRFFHFSGFDPADPAMLSKHTDTRVGGDMAKLVDDYLARLRTAGYESFKSAPYSYGVFADGTLIPDAARVAYRNSPRLQEICGEDPFAHPEVFRGMRDPSKPTLAARVGLKSYRLLSRARPLVRLFPRSLRTGMRELLLGRRDVESRAMQSKTSLPPGLNIVGYLGRDTGVGESARLCRLSCDAAHIPNHPIDVDFAGTIDQRAVYSASIHHVNADQILSVHERLPDVFRDSAYNIGVWHWELQELPDAWTASASPLHEIWAPSAFVQSAISRKVTIPVVHMPHGIELTEIEPCPPNELGVPADRFTFLCMFDLDSVGHRKNPLGAVEAFGRAFPNDSRAALLIKAGRSDAHPREYAELQERLRGIPNVYLTDRMLSRARKNGLLASCDAVVSLHRSEGFGLVLAEAMALGKPAIATGWSGNMDFMNAANSCPVGYQLITLDRTMSHYQAGQQWADPDIDHAAHLMRRVFDDAAFRQQIGNRARDTIQSQFSPIAAGRRYRQRLAFLGLVNR